MLWCLAHVCGRVGERDCLFFRDRMNLALQLCISFVFVFIGKHGKEVLLSHIILAGVRKDVRVDVGRERGGLTLAEHLFFGNPVPCPVFVLLFCLVLFWWKHGKEVRLSHMFWAGAR